VTGRRHSLMRWPAAAVLVLGSVAGCGSGEDDATTDEPTSTASAPAEESTTLVSAGAVAEGTGRCRPPTAEVLAGALTAFDGEVRSIEDDLVTLTVTEWYAGGPTDLVVVQAPPGQQQALVGAVAFEEGGRFLVAARQDGLMVCGLSAPYDEGLAALYAEAFGG
jgi:hypothetical protein